MDWGFTPMQMAVIALATFVAVSVVGGLVVSKWLEASRRATVRVEDQRIRKVLDLD